MSTGIRPLLFEENQSDAIDAPQSQREQIDETTENVEEETLPVGTHVVESDTLGAQHPTSVAPLVLVGSGANNATNTATNDGEFTSASVEEDETASQSPSDDRLRDRNPARQADIVEDDGHTTRNNNDATASENDNENSAGGDEAVKSAKRVCMPCLRCDACDNVLCVREDLYKEVAATFSDQVYTYNLEILGGEEGEALLLAEEGEDAPSQIHTPTSPLPNHYPVYSATNPSAVRFDVVRVASGCYDKKLIACSAKQFSAQHSWFPPYYWCMASCASCGQHLGWGFAEVDVEGTERLKSEFEAKRIEELKRLKIASDEKAKKREEIKMKKAKEGLAKAARGLPLAAIIDGSMIKAVGEQRESESSDRCSNSSSSRRKRARADTTEASAPTTTAAAAAAASLEGTAAEPLLPRRTHVDPHTCSNDENALVAGGGGGGGGGYEADHFISENEENENSRERAGRGKATAAAISTGESQCNAHELNDNDNDEDAHDDRRDEEEASGADDDDDGSWEDDGDEEEYEHEGNTTGNDAAAAAADEGEVEEEDFVDDISDGGESDVDEAKSQSPNEIKAEVLKSISDASLHSFYHQLPPSYQRTKPFVNGGDGLVFKPIAFIGLILTRCRAAEDDTAEQVAENIAAAYRRSFQNAAYHSHRRELYDMLNALPNELRGLANRIGMVALTIHQNYGARSSMADIINQTRNVVEQSRAMAHTTLRANRSPLEINRESDNPSSSASPASSASSAFSPTRHVDTSNHAQAENEVDPPTEQQQESSGALLLLTPPAGSHGSGGEEGHPQRRAVGDAAGVHQREEEEDDGEAEEDDNDEEGEWESCDDEELA